MKASVSYILAFLVGLTVGLTLYIGRVSPAFSLADSLLSLTLTYSVAFFFPTGAALFGVVTTTILGILIGTPYGWLGHITITACLCLFMGYKLARISPLYIIIISWIGLLSFLPEPQLVTILPPHLPLDIGTNFLLCELAILSFFYILRKNKQVAAISRKRPELIAVKELYFHLCFALIIIAFFLLKGVGLALEHSTAVFNAPREHALTILILYSLVSLLIAIIFTRIISSASILVLKALNSVPVTTVSPKCSYRLTLFENLEQNVRSVIQNLSQSLRQSEQDLRTIQNSLTERENSAKVKEQLGYNLTHVLNDASWGCVVLSDTGKVIFVNSHYLSSLELPTDTVYFGKKYSTLQSDHPWSEEIISILDWACKEHKSLIGQGSFRFFSSPYNRTYLIIEVHSSLGLSTKSMEMPVLSRGDSGHQVAVTLFFKVFPDLRDYQAQMLTPLPKDVIQQYSPTLCKDLNEKLKKILDDISEQRKLVNGPRTAETFNNLRLITQDIELLTQAGQQSIDRLFSIPFTNEEYKSVNISAALQDGLNYLYDVMSLGKRMTVRDDSVPVPETHGALFGRQTITPAPPLLITLSSRLFSEFLTYFLSFTRCILPLTTKIDIALATEHIGSGTAGILPASSIGDYVRIHLTHAGQSVPPHMTLRSLADLCGTTRPLATIEIAVTLLMGTVRELGGFITIQSSAARGTSITIYLPVDQNEQVAIEQQLVDDKTAERLPTVHRKAEQTLPYVLLISPETEELPTFQRMVVHLGYHVTHDDPETYLKEEDSLIGFGGSGFGDGTTMLFESQKAPQVKEQSVFDIVVLNTNKEFPINLATIKSIEQKTPGAEIILLVHSQESLGSELAKYPVVRKPFDLDDLKSALEESLSKKREQQQTTTSAD